MMIEDAIHLRVQRDDVGVKIAPGAATVSKQTMKVGFQGDGSFGIAKVCWRHTADGLVALDGGK
jgi:hypothetical protein